MTGRPTHRAVPTGNTTESGVLPYAEPDNTPAPTLHTTDLTPREIAESLWLARHLARNVPPPARPSGPAAPPTPPTDTSTAGPEPPPAPQEPASDRYESWELREKRSIRPAPVDPDDPAVTAPLVWPTAPAAASPLVIARALRPLAATQDSPWHRMPDEEATASAAAETGVWLPRWQPAPWHPFEVAYVIDASPSMELWQRAVHGFRDVLTHQGAFRDVRTYLLDTSPAEVEKLVLRTVSGAVRGWRDLLDPTQRRLVLVVTDTVSTAWHSGAASALLARWGRSMPVAVVQTMPERLWHWGGLAARRMRLSADEPGLSNRRLRATQLNSTLGPTPRRGRRDVVVPVLALDPSWLYNWARLLGETGVGPVNLTAVFADPDGEPDTDSTAEPGPALTAHERVHRFRAFASVDAFRLAGLLAVAPVSLATIGLVQRALLPGAGLDTQAEVLLGGLLHRPIAGSGGFPLDFYEGVREELLPGLYRSDIVHVARLMGDFFGSRFPVLRNFRSALDDPAGTEIPEINPADRPLIKLQAAVLHALSGPYSRRGKAILERLGFARRIPTDFASERDVVEDDRHPDSVSGSLQKTGNARSSAKEVRVDVDVQPPPPDPVTDVTGGTAVTTTGRAVSPPGPARPQAGTPTAIHQPRVWGDVMPLRNPDFVGRDELLQRLRRELAQPGTTAVLPHALHGLGGVGKSQTVTEYIHRYANEYDLVWWIAAEHPTQIRNSFAELARKLGISAVGGADATRAVLEALRKGEPYSRWILVFDNADSPESVTEFLPSGSGHVIVTSRNGEWSGVARTVEVDLFTRAESTELLRRRGGDITDEDADRLAEALGDLPLAIEQAASWRAQTGMPVPEYLKLLEQNRTELLELGSTTVYQSPVAAAWNVPLSQLRSKHPEALALLEICAFFGPEPISRRLFSGVPEAPVPDALRSALSDPIKLNSAIREINKFSLAKIDHRNNTLQLHRLVQAVLKNQVPEDTRQSMRHVAHLLLVNGDPNDPDNSQNWTRYAELLPHAMTSEAMRCHAKWVRALLINLVRYLMVIDDYASGRELSRQTWELWREQFGESDLQTLTMARHYGFILRRQQEFDQARALNRRTYELMLAEYGEDHEALLTVADAVALDLRGEGRFVEELAMRQQTYDRACQSLGYDDPQTLIYGHNLASCLRQVGDYFAARDLDEDVYRRRMSTHGPDHSRTFQSLDAMAMDLRECGDYIGACDMEEDSIRRQREILGSEHRLSTIGALRNLAVARRKAGDMTGALDLSTESYEAYKRRQGELHLDTITALMNMAVDMRQMGELAKAKVHGARSRQQYIEIYKPNHPYVHIASTNHSATLRLLGDAAGARKLNEAALEFYRSKFGSDHPATLIIATNLASDLAALGEAQAAHAMDLDTLDRSKAKLGDDHPSTLAVMLNLSLDLTSLGRTEEAATVHAQAMAGFVRRLGPDHPATRAADQKTRANCDTDTMQL